MTAIVKNRFSNFWLIKYTIKCDKTPIKPTPTMTLATNKNLAPHDVEVGREPDIWS